MDFYPSKSIISRKFEIPLKKPFGISTSNAIKKMLLTSKKFYNIINYIKYIKIRGDKKMDKPKKTCVRCGKTKDITEFYHNFNSKDCYSSICKECQLKANKEWVKNNRERMRELQKNAYERRKAEFYKENN